jgi:thioredoxin reductase
MAETHASKVLIIGSGPAGYTAATAIFSSSLGLSPNLDGGHGNEQRHDRFKDLFGLAGHYFAFLN